MFGGGYIELDFLLTKDNEIICSHQLEYVTGFSLNNRPTLLEFENTMLLNKYHGITFNWLIENLRDNPDLKIIVDSKEANYVNLIKTMISKSNDLGFDLTNNFILQLYSKNNYEQLCDIFSGEFWYTNYKSLYSPNFINYYFGDKPRVTTIVLNVNMWSIYKMHNFETNKKVAVHTINDSDNFNFIKNRKVDYIFTD